MRLYTTPYCQPCQQLKAILDDLGVRYTIIDVACDPAAQRYLTDLGVSGLPVLEDESGRLFRGNPANRRDVMMWLRTG